MPAASLEVRLSDLVRVALASAFPSPHVVRTEVPLYTSPSCTFTGGNTQWPGGSGALLPWKQDICLGKAISVVSADQFDFVPSVTIEAKLYYQTDAMLAAASKVARLRAVYPYLQAVYLQFAEVEWAPRRKAWPLLREFDAYVPVRYAEAADGSLSLESDDVARLVDVVRRLEASAVFVGTKLNNHQAAHGWVRAVEDLRPLVGAVGAGGAEDEEE